MDTCIEIWGVETKVAHLEKMSVELASDMKETRKDIAEIKDVLAEAKGMWKMGAVAAGFVGSLIGFFVSIFTGLFKHD